MNTANDTRKFSIVTVYADDHEYEVHDFDCKRKTWLVQSSDDISTIYGADVEDALRETKEWLAADWGGWPAESNFKIHNCAK